MNELLLSISGEYWIKKLRTVKPVSLFYDKPSSSALSTQVKTVSLPVNENTILRLMKVSGGEASGIYVILMSVLHTLLLKYTGESGFLVATGNLDAIDSVDRQCCPVLFFKLSPDRQTTPRQLFKQSLEELNEIIRHQYVETSYLDDKFGSSEERKLFDQIGLLYQPFNTFDEQAGTKDLMISLEKSDIGYSVVLHYKTALYSQEQVLQLGAHFTLLLASLLDNPDKTLGEISFLHPQEMEAIIANERRNQEYVVESTVVSMFEAAAVEFGQQDALITNDDKLTYKELNEAANRVAHYLRISCGVRPNDVVGVMLNRSENLVIVILGILKSGAAFMPVDPAFPSLRKEYMFSDAAVRLLIVDVVVPAISDYYSGQIFDTKQLFARSAAHSHENPVSISSSDDLAYIIYTSGSTGQPKGVLISNSSIAHYLIWANKYYFNDTPGYRFALFSPLTFDLTLTSLFSGLLRGDGLVITSDEAIEDTLKKIFTGMQHVNTVKLTPSHVNLLREFNLNTTPISVVIIGGEALHRQHVDILKVLNPDMLIYNEYGPTEATVGCMVKRIESCDAAITIGKAIDHTCVYILDAHNDIVPPGVAGELGITGAGLAKGYLNQLAFTAQRFVEFSLEREKVRLYKTGDLAVQLPDGEYRYLGRKDRQLKVKAFRIEPGEIEVCIKSYTGITDAVVLANEEEGQGMLMAYYTTSATVLAIDLLEYLQNHLPVYMIPAHLTEVDNFPLTPHGKIDQKALLERELPSTLRRDHRAPENEMEKILAGIWQEVLGVTDISTDEQFLHLKGDSIRAIRICNRIRKATGDTIPITALFEADTVRKLAAYINNARCQADVNRAAITAAAVAEYYELSHAQERIWTTAQLEENKISYNICMNRMLQDVDPELLIRALRQLLLRHDSLRTVFHNLDGHPRQKVLADVDWFNVTRLDLSHHPNRQEMVKELYDQETQLPLDIENTPPLRVSLIQLDRNTSVLLFTLHHIIADAWTMDVLYKDMQAIYASLVEYGESRLPSLKLQYKDFVAWEKEQLSGTSLGMHKDYWLSVFKPPIPLLQMTTDFPRPAVMTYNGVSTVLQIDTTLRDSLKEVGRKHNASLFMVLLAALKTLLHRYTGQQDLIIGSPFAGRSHPALEDQVGIFINLFAFRTKIAAEDKFEDLLGKVKDAVLSAYDHQIYPFDFIIKDLKMERNPARAPLFDVIFSLQNIGLDAINLADEVLYGDIPDVFTQNSKFDLNFIISEHEKGMICFIKYNKDLFRKESISKLKHRFITVLESIALNPAIPLEDIVLSDLSTVDEHTAGNIRSRFNVKF